MTKDTLKSNCIRGVMVCCMTAGLLLPSVITFGLIWQKHLEFVNPPSLVAYEIGKTGSSRSSDRFSASPSNWPELACSSIAPTHSRESVLPLFDARTIATTLLSTVVIMPLSFCLGVLFYRRYHIYQIATFKEQVASLEKLWRQKHC